MKKEKVFELSGVYIITNKINGKFYVGSGRSIFSRWFNHTCYLTKSTHVNYKLQRAVNKYGLENFKFEVLELHPPQGLNEREQYYLDTLCKAQEYIKGTDSFFNQQTYNIKPLVEGTTGLPQQIEKIVKGVRTRGFDKILKVSRTGGIIKEYELQSLAADDNNISRVTVSNSIKHKRCPKDKDYYFVYEKDYDENFIPKIVEVHNKGVKGVVNLPSNYKEVYCYDVYGRFYKKFESNKSVAEYFDTFTSTTCRMIDNPKKKILHRHGIHLYNLYSFKQHFETKILDRIKSFEQDGDIEVYTLFHEFVGSFSKETIANFLECHLHSVSQSVTQNKILKGFYFIRED